METDVEVDLHRLADELAGRRQPLHGLSEVQRETIELALAGAYVEVTICRDLKRRQNSNRPLSVVTWRTTFMGFVEVSPGAPLAYLRNLNGEFEEWLTEHIMALKVIELDRVRCLRCREWVSRTTARPLSPGYFVHRGLCRFAER